MPSKENKKRPKGPFPLPKLPPNINYGELVEHLSKAHSSLARLDEMLKQEPIHHLIENTFLTQEAVLSSKIEGTQVTLEDVLKQEAEAGQKVSEADERGRDIREVFNYRRALFEGTALIDQKQPLAENNVKKLHRILLQSVRGKTRAPGEFRKEQVYIGPPGTPISEARYIPPSPVQIPELYSNFDRYFNSTSAERDVLVQTAIAHYQFEAIHPFKDGNGRMGRLLIPLFLYDRKIIARPLMYVSKYFEEHRRDYYDLLADVSYEEAWIPWIRFFLNGLCVQAQEAIEVGHSILRLRENIHKELRKFNSPSALNLMEAMFRQPYFTPKSIRAVSNIRTQQTVLTLVEKFHKEGLLRDLTPNKRRNKLYAFQPLVELMDGKKERPRKRPGAKR
jgi:Fic family protein